jgi:hypothetical protein
MTNDEMQKEIARLKAENDKLKTKTAPSLSLKVSEKGGVSLYGLGRWPVTLYREQWLRVLGMSDEIRAFIQANTQKLKEKGET